MPPRELMISDFRAVLADAGEELTLNGTELLAIVKDGGTEMLGETDERSRIGGVVSVKELRFLYDDYPHMPRVDSDIEIDGETWTVNARWNLCKKTQLKLQVYQERY